MHPLRKRLAYAADGIVAQHGAGAPNLFQEALEEIKRLDAIERDVKILLDVIYPLDMQNDIRKRQEAGLRLGQAVGVFPKTRG